MLKKRGVLFFLSITLKKDTSSLASSTFQCGIVKLKKEI
jgi:hypothetical protein